MTFYTSPWVLGKNTLYTSTVVNGDLDTVAKIMALNNAFAHADNQTIVFDRGYNITIPRTTRVYSTSSTDVFRIPAGRRIIGDPSRPIATPSWDKLAVNGTQRYIFSARGSEGSFVNLSANAVVGRETISVGTSGVAALSLSVGDKVRITSDKLFVAGGTVGAEEQGEIATVVSVGSGSFDILPPLQDTYLASDNARVAKVTTVSGLLFEGIRIVGVGMLQNGADPVADAVFGDRGFHLTLCDGLKLSGVSTSFVDNGNYIYSSPDGKVEDFRAEFETTNAQSRAQNQYGVALVNGCQDFLVDSAYVIGGKHAVVQTESSISPAVTRRCKIKNSTAIGTWNYGIAVHTNAERIEVDSNYLEGCSGGVEAGCRSFLSRNNEVRFLKFVAGDIGNGIAVTDIAEDVFSDGDRVYGGGFGFRCDNTSNPLFSGSVGPTKIRLHNFLASGSNQDGVRILWSGSGARSDFEITDLRTENIGQPVDANGYPTTGSRSAANSIDIRGTSGNVLQRVKIAGANLHAWESGTASSCFVGEYITGLHYSDISYNSFHSAPVLTTGITSAVASNINQY